MTTRYLLHTIQARPREWPDAARELAEAAPDRLGPAGGALFGIWRSQIGRPRDEVTAITSWRDDVAADEALVAADDWLTGHPPIQTHERRVMTPTLRPKDATPPERQGNYAFRYFTTPQQNFEEFLALCEAAWPGFEAAYDSQVIGLWRFADATAEGSIDTLLLTRRPDLAMWERSKLPADAAEQEVRDKLSRRYDLCDATWVVTTTLITARDRADEARWA
jgi:hypothetical protein